MKMAFEVDGKEYQIRFGYSRPSIGRTARMAKQLVFHLVAEPKNNRTDRHQSALIAAKKELDLVFKKEVMGPRCTHAAICEISDPNPISTGFARCAVEDTFIAETGRRLALGRALENHTKAFRVEAWAAYNGRKGHKATLKDRIAWPSMKSVDVDAEDARALGVSELGDAHTDAIKKVLGSKNPQSSGTLPGTAVERAEFLNALRDALFDSIERSIGKLN